MACATLIAIWLDSKQLYLVVSDICKNEINKQARSDYSGVFAI